jgi:hypothetical protein
MGADSVGVSGGLYLDGVCGYLANIRIHYNAIEALATGKVSERDAERESEYVWE